MPRGISGFLAALCVSVAVPTFAGSGAGSQPMIGETAPAFSLKAVSGETLDLADLRGRWLVVHFGASW